MAGWLGFINLIGTVDGKEAAEYGFFEACMA